MTDAQRRLVALIDRAWTRERALHELKAHLRVAIEVALATIPIHLYAGYSTDRTPKGLPDSAISRLADHAGATCKSEAAEELLHMWLARLSLARLWHFLAIE